MRINSDPTNVLKSRNAGPSAKKKKQKEERQKQKEETQLTQVVVLVVVCVRDLNKPTTAQSTQATRISAYQSLQRSVY